MYLLLVVCKMQNTFLKLSTFYCNINSFDFKSLTERLVEFDVTFIYTVLNGVSMFLIYCLQ